MNADIDAVIEQVRAMCASISGVRSAVSPSPEPLPALGLPLCAVDLSTPRVTPHSYTEVKLSYTLTLTLILGGPDMSRANAARLAAPFYGRFVDKFWADRRLGGSCDHSTLQHGVTNLRSYARKKTNPKITWVLAVEHYGTPGG